jgi:hypothetical protein
MLQNTAGQTWVVFAWHTDTGLPAEDIQASITANLILDGGSPQATDDVNPTQEVGKGGFYYFNIALFETAADSGSIRPSTILPNIQVFGSPPDQQFRFNVNGSQSGVIDADALYSLFGEDNIRTWADLDNDQDGTKIDNRIASAISDTTDEVEDELRGHLDLTDITSVTGVRRVITRLAGIDLYTRRGYEDENTLVSSHRKVANAQLQRIITDLARTGHARKGTRSPGVVVD